MNLVILLRHGETDANRERKLLGQQDPSLNERGIEESKVSAKWIASFASTPITVLSSPKRRAVETANIVASKLGGLPVREEARLLERDLGDFDHRLRADLTRTRIDAGHLFRDVTQDWEGVANVETDADVAARALSCVDTKPDLQQTVILVTHAGVAKSIFHVLFAVSPERRAVLKVRNGGAVAFTFRQDCVAFEGLFNPRVVQ